MIEKFVIKHSLVDELVKSLELLKLANFKASEDVATVNGFQTANILDFLSTKCLIDEVLEDITKQKKVMCTHVHLIEYLFGGYQLEHDHKGTEDYSFILYLNDSDGDTVFASGERVTPKKGQLIYFKSDMLHSAEKSNLGKKIAVGALVKRSGDD